MAALRGTRELGTLAILSRRNKQFCLSLTQISIIRISFNSKYTWNLQGEKRTRGWSAYKASSFAFTAKMFTPTPVPLEIKNKKDLNPFLMLSTVCRGRRQLCLTDQLGSSQKREKVSFYRNFEFKPNACLHNTINKFRVSISFAFRL